MAQTIAELKSERKLRDPATQTATSAAYLSLLLLTQTLTHARRKDTLNPDEQVWNHSKARLGKMFIETKEHLVAEVRNVLRSIQMSRDLILSFFQLKDTTYASDAC